VEHSTNSFPLMPLFIMVSKHSITASSVARQDQMMLDFETASSMVSITAVIGSVGESVYIYGWWRP
jgi:hypothetical protein